MAPVTSTSRRELLSSRSNCCRDCSTFAQPLARAHCLAKSVLSDPDRVVARLDSFISAYGARMMLFEMWAANPKLFELLIWLFDRSEFLAERAIRTPDLIEHLDAQRSIAPPKNTQETWPSCGTAAATRTKSSGCGKHYQTELMRIGLREIVGLADLEQHEEELERAGRSVSSRPSRSSCESDVVNLRPS